MTTPTFVRVNNIEYSWNSCGFFINNFGITGLVEVNYAEKREQKTVHANKRNGVMLGYTTGKYEMESFSMKLLKKDSANVLAYLASLSLGSYGDTEWTYTESISEPVIGDIPVTNVITVCRVQNVKNARAEGVDAIVDELTIGCKQLITNGLTLASTVRALMDAGY